MGIPVGNELLGASFRYVRESDNGRHGSPGIRSVRSSSSAAVSTAEDMVQRLAAEDAARRNSSPCLMDLQRAHGRGMRGLAYAVINQEQACMARAASLDLENSRV